MKNNKYARISTIQVGDKLCNIHNLSLYELDYSIENDERGSLVFVLRHLFSGEQRKIGSAGIREAFINVSELWEKRGFGGCLPTGLNINKYLSSKNFLNARYSDQSHNIEDIVERFLKETHRIELRHHCLNLGTIGCGQSAC